MPAYEVKTKSLAPQAVAALRDILPAYGDIGRLFNEFGQYFAENKFAPVGPPVTVYHDHEYKDRDVDIELAFPVAGDVPATERIKPRELSGEELVACVVHHGSYEGVGNGYAALMEWAEKNGYEICSTVREVYLKGPEPDGDTSQCVTELQIPVKKA